MVTGVWWDYVDQIAAQRIGPILRAHPGTEPARMRAWARDDDLWVRRTAILCQLGSHEATDLYGASHSAGTLTSFTRHTSGTPGEDAAAPPWLEHPGDQDITAHVDFTSVRTAAEDEGLTTLGFLDQTYFILGLIGAEDRPTLSEGRPTLSGSAADAARTPSLRERLALKTLLMPGGLGSTMKVLIFGKEVGCPALTGCSYRVRVT